jgi:hypothetical protein
MTNHFTIKHIKSMFQLNVVYNRSSFLGCYSGRKVLTIVTGVGVLFMLILWQKSHTKALTVSDIVVVDPPVFDFGTVFQAQTISHSFSLFNRSDLVVCVVGIKTTCSCTAVGDEVVGKIILPGKHLAIPVDYTVGDRKGPLSSFVSIFVIATNAIKDLYEVQAHMEGTALPEFTVEPDSVDFGSLKPGDQSSKIVTFRAGNAMNLKISDPVSNVQEFQVSMQQNKSNLSDVPPTAVITFQAPTNATRQETISEVVQFKTSSERVPKASIYVVGRIVPDVEIIPNMIIVPSSGLSEGGQVELTIRTGEPSHVLNLTRKYSNTSLDIQSSNNLTTADAWNKIHHLRIPNALLVQALGVGVELEVHDGADRIEARSVFVPIKSLYSQITKQ